MIALPCDIVEQHVCLTFFHSSEYRKLSISGQGLKVSLKGEARYVEEFHSNRDGSPTSLKQNY
jgi:hypothetical protein